MSEMVSRVANVLREINLDLGGVRANLSAAKAEECARAAIAAMREPTKEMLEAGADGSGEDSETVAEGAWEFMIDAALK